MDYLCKMLAPGKKEVKALLMSMAAAKFTLAFPGQQGTSIAGSSSCCDWRAKKPQKPSEGSKNLT